MLHASRIALTLAPRVPLATQWTMRAWGETYTRWPRSPHWMFTRLAAINSPYPADDLMALWTHAQDPCDVGLTPAIARDIATFTGEPEADVLSKMERGKELFKEFGITAEAVVEAARQQLGKS